MDTFRAQSILFALSHVNTHWRVSIKQSDMESDR